MPHHQYGTSTGLVELVALGNGQPRRLIWRGSITSDTGVAWEYAVRTHAAGEIWKSRLIDILVPVGTRKAFAPTDRTFKPHGTKDTRADIYGRVRAQVEAAHAKFLGESGGEQGLRLKELETLAAQSEYKIRRLNGQLGCEQDQLNQVLCEAIILTELDKASAEYAFAQEQLTRWVGTPEELIVLARSACHQPS